MCEECPVDNYGGMLTKEEAEQRADEAKVERIAMEKSVNINGSDFKLKDLFSNTWDAKDFASKINLIEKAQTVDEMPDKQQQELLGGISDD